MSARWAVRSDPHDDAGVLQISSRVLHVACYLDPSPGGFRLLPGRAGPFLSRLALDAVPPASAGADSDRTGLYAGRYGPHGDELVSVRSIGGALVGVKVTGDPNVPAGKVTFRTVQGPAKGPRDFEEESRNPLVCGGCQHSCDCLKEGAFARPVAEYRAECKLAASGYGSPAWDTARLVVADERVEGGGEGRPAWKGGGTVVVPAKVGKGMFRVREDSGKGRKAMLLVFEGQLKTSIKLRPVCFGMAEGE